MFYTLKHLRYLVTIAETKNISKAADVLNIAQPSLSAAIRQLENQFDTDFLIRYKAKGVALTPAGRKFVTEARQLLLHNDELTKNMGDFGKGVDGEITLGCYTTIAPFFIPNLLRRAKQTHPKLFIKTLEKNLDELQEDLSNGQYELALLYNINLDQNIKVRTLKKCKPYIVLSNKHPLSNRRRINLKDLCDDPYIMLDLPNSRDYFRKVFATNNVDPNIIYQTRSFEMVRCLVAQGHGYSILNLLPSHTSTYDGGEVSCVELVGKHAPLEIVLAQVNNLKITHRAKQFSEFCVRYFKNV